MEMKFIEKTPEGMKFLISGITVSMANALRRSVLEIPILAIDVVEFIKNDSALYDEMLALRFGLLPLVNQKDLELIEDCTCKDEGCSKCTVSLKLTAKGPGLVKASLLKGKAEVVYKEMPLITLAEGQQIELNAYARLGKGTTHTKYSPGILSYLPEPTITVNNKSSKFNEFKGKYPPQIFKNGEIAKELITPGPLLDASEGICEDIVKVTYSEDNFIFTLESFGQIPAKDIFIESIKALQQNLKQLDKSVEKL